MIDGLPVVDAVVHPYNLNPANEANSLARPISEMLAGGSQAFAAGPEYQISRNQFLRDWSIEETANMVFLESDTDLAAYHVLPINAYKDGLCSLDKALEAKRRWPNRFVFYCGVDPLGGQQALDELDRQAELLEPTGLKLYPNSWVGNVNRGWLMDDPEVAFPLFERARSLGIKVVAVHKAVPLGAVEMRHYRVDDIDRAAAAFPDLSFEIVHGGMAFLEETAWQLARFPNVWVNLEITTMILTRRPESFGHALATLTGVGGPHALDKICWGTGAMAVHPRPLLERFVRDFQLTPANLKNGTLGELEPLDRETKGKILFDNYERLVGLDLKSRLASLAGDEFGVQRADGQLAAPYTTTSIAAEPAHA
jgi:predicted TIM-barrel fold metal-dependent hydrolase